MRLLPYYFFLFFAGSVKSFSATKPSGPATTASNTGNSVSRPSQPIIPITVLGGFLGSGKTTLLQHLLQNQQGLRIAVVVNDVASVNIDSKLIANTPASAGNVGAASGLVELQNGCACCSRSEELLASVSELVTLSDMKKPEDAFDHIVVELSGVADPRSVRAKFQEAMLYDMPLMDRVQLDTMVTVIDGSTFLPQLQSSALATADDAPELFYRPDENPNDDRTWQDDLPPGLLEALQAGERASANTVADLLVAQTECADVVLLNKVDLVDNQNDVRRVQALVRSLNPRATVLCTQYGQVPLKQVLAVANGAGVVEAGIIDDHRDAVDAATHQTSPTVDSARASDHTHDSNDLTRTDTSHAHSHEHQSSVGNGPDCTETSHTHAHSHDHQECSDSRCNDPTHSHSHDHDAVATTYFGIGSFVYRGRRPFHPARLVAFVRNMNLQRGLPHAAPDEANLLVLDDKVRDCLRSNVVRSKGFIWCANSYQAAQYWSHAGTSFELSQLGRWWATLPRNQWPPEAVDTILLDFDDHNHEDGQAAACQGESVGDRRQEVVFIGPSLDDETLQKSICTALDECLLNDDEWRTFLQHMNDEEALAKVFPNPIAARLMTL